MASYNYEGGKYYSRKTGEELYGCARDNCEIHRYGGWADIKKSVTATLELLKAKDEKIARLEEVVVKLSLLQDSTQATKNKKF